MVDWWTLSLVRQMYMQTGKTRREAEDQDREDYGATVDSEVHARLVQKCFTLQVVPVTRSKSASITYQSDLESDQ